MLRVRERAGSLLGLESAFRNAVSHSQISHWGEPNVDTMPLPLKLNSLINEIRERLGRSPHKSRLAQKPVNGSRACEHHLKAHAHDRN